MAAYAAIVSLMNNMEQIMNHPRLSNCFDNEQVQSLLQKAGSLLEFIESHHYNHGGFVTEEAEVDLERQITCAAQAAEDVVETHVVDQIHAGTLCSMDLRQVIQDMGAVAERAMEVKKKEEVLREEEQATTHSRIQDVESRGTAMVGLEDELTQLLDSLTDNHSNRHVISIVGMGGTGKTTLARNLYVNPLIKEHFDIRCWGTISQQYDAQDILSQLLSCLGKPTEGKVGELGERLHKTLIGRRYLIVLDDIWGVDAWDKVRRYFPDDGNKSRVVLTTRLSDVASVCASTCFNLNLLDEDKSWKLFCENAQFPHKDDPLELEKVAKKIVKSCKGLALSIVVIGGLLLKSPRSVWYWKSVLYDLGETYSKEKQQGLDVLSLSYTHLPPHLKPCFLYMGVYKEDSRIHASEITRLWVAEGFIKPNGSRALEEIGEEYLKDMSDRNLILGVESRFNGKIKSFSMHDLLRDLCIKVSRQQKSFHFGQSSKGRIVDRRHVTEWFESAFARSIFWRGYHLNFVKCKLLRVLNADGVVVLSHHAELYENVNLRYLAYGLPYNGGGEVELPISICLVWNLQALIMKSGSESPPLIISPLEIWKIRQLRHVECKNIYLPDLPLSPPLDCMENLQTLKRAVNLRMSEELCEITPNIKKLGLIYNPELRGYDGSLIECLRNLDRLHKLESLSMEINSNEWWDPELHPKLAFPLSLMKLSLIRCKLGWEDVSMIGSLPQLQVLHLKSLAVRGDQDHMWSPVSGKFLRLKLLEMEVCQLESWDADSSHFPVLESSS